MKIFCAVIIVLLAIKSSESGGPSYVPTTTTTLTTTPITMTTTTVLEITTTPKINTTTSQISTTTPKITSTQIPTTTTKKPSSICTYTTGLYDAAGNYLKSICIPSTRFDYGFSSTICNENGMNLYAITNAAEYKAVIEFINRYYAGGLVYVWINGIQDRDGTWYVYNPNKTPLYSEAAPMTSYFSGQNYLMLASPTGTRFITQGNSNYVRTVSFCEY